MGIIQTLISWILSSPLEKWWALVYRGRIPATTLERWGKQAHKRREFAYGTPE